MFGIIGDDLTIVLFLIGAAMTVAGTAMGAAGWKHKIYIGSLFILAGLFAIAAFSWIALPQAKDIYPLYYNRHS